MRLDGAGAYALGEKETYWSTSTCRPHDIASAISTIARLNRHEPAKSQSARSPSSDRK